METNVRTPVQIFGLPQQLVVPLFQRPYVWAEEEQWEPLWQDIRRMAEVRLRDPYSTAAHFLGAVVVQAHDGALGNMAVSNIIDGQQRLTTLQLLMDATGAVLEEAGLDQMAGQLESLTHNQINFLEPGQSGLKIRHTNRDQAAFDEVMSAPPPIDHDGLAHAGSLVAKAHAYFSRASRSWLEENGEDQFDRRAHSLVSVLTSGLQLVAINLSAAENSQEIFETLNARGTPLTAADLIKNYVFQRLAAEGADTKLAYAQDWPFDSRFWETEVSAGRYKVSRSSLFLNQWLISRTGEEVGAQQTFTRFKSFVEHEGSHKMSDLLPVIKAQADRYESWTVAAADPDRQLDRVELAVYRMRANDIEVLKPLLIWLHAPDRSLTSDQVAAVVAVVESWIVRRFLLRLTSADHGRIVAELIQAHRDTPADELADRISGYLSRLNAASTYWPGDEEIRGALRVESVYRRFRRGRLRMVLEAVEDVLRVGTNQPQVPRRGYPIEHVLPQRWQPNWGVDGLEAELERAAHVHRLGNLTLLTTALNSKVSNGPWLSKRDALRAHDTLLMNSRLLHSAGESGWDEESIDARTDLMVDVVLTVWPVPEGHVGSPEAAPSRAETWVEIKHLLAAGLLDVGARLVPRPGMWASEEALVLSDGRLAIGEKTFDSPSGAGQHVKGGITNGWHFWRLPDGRKLVELRAEYRGEEPRRQTSGFDWAALHAILSALPRGSWTSYGNLAEAVGTAPQPLGSHITSCPQCENAHRVLTARGQVAPNFAWSDEGDTRDPQELLEAEGLAFIDGRADISRLLSAAELREMADSDR